MLETFSAFLTSDIATFAPLTFLEHIAAKGSIAQAVAATPIISVIIPSETKNTITTTETAIPTFESKNSLSTLKASERLIAITRILKGLNERMWIRPILQVHDELVVEVPKDKLKEAASFIKKCMEERPFEDFDVPLVAEASLGKTFGKLKEIEVMGSGN